MGGISQWKMTSMRQFAAWNRVARSTSEHQWVGTRCAWTMAVEERSVSHGGCRFVSIGYMVTSENG